MNNPGQARAVNSSREGQQRLAATVGFNPRHLFATAGGDGDRGDGSGDPDGEGGGGAPERLAVDVPQEAQARLA